MIVVDMVIWINDIVFRLDIPIISLNNYIYLSYSVYQYIACRYNISNYQVILEKSVFLNSITFYGIIWHWIQNWDACQIFNIK